MRRLAVGLIAATVAGLAFTSPVFAQERPTFKLGFKALADQIPEVVGLPTEAEHHRPSGDSLQQTTTGLMVWRKADNWTAFTDGARTWINGPFGTEQRANDDRFEWEALVPTPLPPSIPEPISTPVLAPVHSPTTGYNPPTAEEAIARVRASTEVSQAVSPFKQEVDWKAEWTGDRWWVIGLLESPWGVRFVADATIWDGRVYAYVNYSMRPKREWVEIKAREWGLEHLYTRLTPAEALARVAQSEAARIALKGVTVLDTVAELVEDTSMSAAWRFAYHITQPDSRTTVLVVDGLGGGGAKEGNYVGGYGFGNATKAEWEVPLNLVDWVRQLAKARGWEKAVNLP